MATALTYKWDNSQAYTDAFEFTTKYYDLGSTTLSKNVYTISLTFGPDNSSFNLQNVIGQPLVLSIHYRTEVNQPFQFYHLLKFFYSWHQDYQRLFATY